MARKLKAESSSSMASSQAESLVLQSVAPVTSSAVMVDEPARYPPKQQEALDIALDDVQTRFLYNLPPEELASSDRIFFQIEQAWWFYEDILRDDLCGSDVLPKFKKLVDFAKEMFRFSPMLQPLLPQFDSMWTEFSEYRRKISSYGTILMNTDLTKLVLVQGWKGNSWTFPAGKVNQNESGPDAGARECFEETGFDPNCSFGICKEMVAAGLTLTWEPLKEEDAIIYYEDGKQRTCYVCKGVPESFPFAPVVRKEISDVAWYNIDQLPKRTYAVLPFLPQLKKWIQRNKPTTVRRSDSFAGEGGQQKRDGSRKKNDRPSSRHSSRGKDRLDVSSLIISGLASDSNEQGWAVDDMFRVNEEMTGRKVAYDGNPQYFASKGFDGVDPHSFRVVGGHFMNTNTVQIAPAPTLQSLQPLFHNAKAEAVDDGFKPFFSSDGATPWSVIPHENKQIVPADSRVEIIAEDMRLHEPENILNATINETSSSNLVDNINDTKDADRHSDWSKNAQFLTDYEITERHQKLLHVTSNLVETESLQGENEHLEFLRHWVNALPSHPPTIHFGDFRFDSDQIMLVIKDQLQS